MANTYNFRFKGLEDVRTNFEKAIDRVEKAAFRRALGKASTPTVKEARRRAKEFQDTGALARSITKKVKSYRQNRTVMAYVGPRADFTFAGRTPVKYAHIVERGSSKMSPRPFLRPAHRATESEVQLIFAKEIGNDIEREAEKAGKRL